MITQYDFHYQRRELKNQNEILSPVVLVGSNHAPRRSIPDVVVHQPSTTHSVVVTNQYLFACTHFLMHVLVMLTVVCACAVLFNIVQLGLYYSVLLYLLYHALFKETARIFRI